MNRAQSDFARVYSEHVWPIYGFLAYRLGDRQVAEDLTQATFERALRAWSRFDLLIDHHRRDRNRRTELLEEHLEPPVAGPEESITAGPDLSDALSKLSDRDREILALRFGGDLNGPEIAEVLGLSLANVQQIISRSLRKLRELLEEEHGRPGRPGAVLQNPHRGEGAERDQQ